MVRFFFSVVLILSAAAAWAQGANVAFGTGLNHDSSLPVEASGDALEVRQNENVAIFTGNVIVTQGALRLTSDNLRVENEEGGGKIKRIVATGNVTMVNGSEAAEGQRAVYTLANGALVMTGDVLLTQGASAIAGERLDVDLNTGVGQMTGRVKTILQTADQ